MPSQADIEHLLRRTEFVARPERVAELMAKPSLEACVDDILAVPSNPGSVTFTQPTEWTRAEELTYFWFNRMAHDSPRPIQEKMALFWHGHFCSSIWKVELAGPMREQIDLFRTYGLQNLRLLAISMSTQSAMLRYLDNNQNLKSSPNQNFARELMELFLLGVGNYTEADVEASAAAWTGHTEIWASGQYVWRPDWHDGTVKTFLGRQINSGADHTRHGADTIDVVMGNGVVPAGAARNVGRPTSEVCAEFITRKMWTFFAGTSAPDEVVSALRSVALANGFNVSPWLRAMLLRPEFYANDVKQGLVRSPVDLMVAYLVATGLRADPGVPLWWLEGMGQRPLAPPDVSGWKHNSYFVNASAMSKRSLAARYMYWNTMLGFWAGDGLIHLGRGNISRDDMEYLADRPEQFVDLVLSMMGVSPTATSREVLYAHARSQPWWERVDVVCLALLMPEFHVA